MSGMRSFDPLNDTTWAPSGTFSTQNSAAASSGPGSDGTRKTTEYIRGSTGSKNNNGKRGQQLPANDTSTTVDPFHLGTSFEPWPEISPNKKRRHSDTAQTTEEFYQVAFETGSPYSDQEWWQRENTIVIPDDEPGSISDQDMDILGDDDNENDKYINHLSPRAVPTAPHAPQLTASDHRARNRTAATKCRAKAKLAANELETTERESESRHRRLSAQATDLQNEVLALKNEVLRHGNCDSKIIQDYLSNAARRVYGGGRI